MKCGFQRWSVRMYATMLALDQGGRDVVVTMFGVPKKKSSDDEFVVC